MPKRLLLIDPIPTHRIRLKAALRAAQYDIVSIDRVACAKTATVGGTVDLIILNTSGADPTQMIARLKMAFGRLDVPVLCRDEEADSARRVQALTAGASDMLATCVPMSLLLARLRALLRDKEASTELERRRLAAESFGFREASTPFEMTGQIIGVTIGAAELEGQNAGILNSHPVVCHSCDELLHDGRGIGVPDAIMLSVGADGTEALDAFLPEIRARGHLRQASVIVLYPPRCWPIAERALNLGAADVAETGSTSEELTHRVDKLLSRKRVGDALRKSTEESFRLAATDVLTGLYNRRYADVYLADALVQSFETGRALTILMVDVDHFKRVNDTFGHSIGDVALREIAGRLRDNLRAVDLVSRYGGEEFLVVMPDIDGPEAELAADRLRAEISRWPIGVPNGSELVVTVSIGVATSCPQRSAFGQVAGRSGVYPAKEPADTKAIVEGLVDRADRALYAAKNAGRNRVAVSALNASAA